MKIKIFKLLKDTLPRIIFRVILLLEIPLQALRVFFN